MKKSNIAALNAQDSANFWKKKYEKLEKEFEQYKKESIKWSVEDLLEYDGYKISKKNAQIALLEMIKDHDCEYGITWQSIEYYLEKYGKKLKD